MGQVLKTYRGMKKAIVPGVIVLSIFLAAILVRVDPELVLITMIAYWVFLDRLEREDEK